MDWKTLLAHITGTVNQELLLRNEYLVAENCILRNQLKGRLRLNDGERKALADIGQKLGKQALKEVTQMVKPGTILGWYRKLVAQKFDGSQQRKAPGRLHHRSRVGGVDRAHGARHVWGRPIGWSAPSPTWAIRPVTRQSAMSSSAMVSYWLLHGRRSPPAASSSARTWRCWWPPTSSPLRSGPWAGW